MSLYSRTRFRIDGDRALLAEYGEGVDLQVNDKVRKMAEVISRKALAGVETVTPSYRSLLVVYDPLSISPAGLQEHLLDLEKDLDQTEIPAPRTVEIPVCYGGELGPDIQFVAECNHLSVDEVVRLHSGQSYHIYAIGFAPGFCYLGGLDKRLHTPRLETPRTFVPAGSVGIAEAQTGVYPLNSPGGWRLIGRTPLRLFAPDRADPILYRTGDTIQFKAISTAEFERIQRQEAS